MARKTNAANVDRTVILAAGGTGGHLFPASALGTALKARGFRIVLITDERGARYDDRFPADAIHVVSSDTVRAKTPRSLVRTMFSLGKGVAASRAHVRTERPGAVVGFGGYPSFPPLVAARLAGVPIVLHEQNAVLGRANKAAARFAKRIALGFPRSGGRDDARLVVTGNPLRPEALSAAQEARPIKDDRFRLLVFGGSQGARVFSDVMPGHIEALPEDLRARLSLVQQARPEDLDAVKARYAAMGVAAEVSSFFSDMPRRIAESDLVIARAGASTVSEIAAIGRPSILVPLPHSLDQDQAANARVLEAAGGARVVRQDAFAAPGFPAALTDLMKDATTLETMARAARGTGRHDAAERLADVVEDVISESRP